MYGILLLLMVLMIAGCSDKYVAENLAAKGCHIKCDWCVNMDATCAEQYEIEDGETRNKFNPLGIPDIEVDVEVKKGKK